MKSLLNGYATLKSKGIQLFVIATMFFSLNANSQCTPGEPISIWDFNITNGGVCPGSEISGNVSLMSSDSISWTYNGGTEFASSSWLYSFSIDAVGEYPIECYVRNACGADTIIYDTIEVKLFDHFQGTKNFDITDTVCAEGTVNFHSPGQQTVTKWTLGDGSEYVSDDTWFEYDYLVDGEYTACVYVEDGCENDTMLCDTVVVIENDIVNMDYWSVSYDTLCPGEIKNFYSYFSGSYAYRWEDGSTYQGEFDKSFNQEGVYHFEVEFFNACGNSKVFEDSIIVKSNVNYGIDTSYIQIRDTVCTNEIIGFNGARNPKYNIWNLGDGTVDTTLSEVFDYRYETEGVYEVSLTIEGYCGVEKTMIDTVWVNNSIKPDLSEAMYFKDTVCPGETVLMISQLGGNNVNPHITTTWEVEDGQTASGLIAEFAMNDAGSYEVTLTTQGLCGEEIVATDTIVVGAYPYKPSDLFEEGYNLSDARVCLGDSISFISIPYQEATILTGDGNQVIPRKEYVSFDGSSEKIGVGIANYKYPAHGAYFPKAVFERSCGTADADTLEIEFVRVRDKERATAHFGLMYDQDLYGIELCYGGPTYFFFTGGSRYEIDFGDGTDTIINTATMGTIGHTFQTEGTYSITCVVSNSCDEWDTTTVVVNVVRDCPADPNSSEEVQTIDFSVYPNPAQNYFKVEVPNYSTAVIEVANIAGQLVSQSNLNNGSKLINTSNWPAGIYFVNVSSNRVKSTKMVIVTK